MKTAEAIWQARQKCPDLVVVPPDYAAYKRYSKLARMIYYDYTNSGDSQSSAFVDFTLQASQNGESLEGTYPEATDDAVDNYMNTIDPGKTVTVCQVFLLKDTTSDVTLQGKETLNVSGGQTTSQVLKLK